MQKDIVYESTMFQINKSNINNETLNKIIKDMPNYNNDNTNIFYLYGYEVDKYNIDADKLDYNLAIFEEDMANDLLLDLLGKKYPFYLVYSENGIDNKDYLILNDILNTIYSEGNKSRIITDVYKNVLICKDYIDNKPSKDNIYIIGLTYEQNAKINTYDDVVKYIQDLHI